MPLLDEIKEAVEEGHPKSAETLVRQALEKGFSPQSILNEALVPAIRQAGDAYHNNEIFIARILACARAMRNSLEILKPYLLGSSLCPLGTMILGTVEGDLHDIGKNLVHIMFESVGFQVIDLGVDVSGKQFIRALQEHPETKIICISTLLTTTMWEIAPTIKALRKLDKKHEIYIMIGGAPITQEFADEVGADYYTETAWDAARLAQKLMTDQK